MKFTALVFSALLLLSYGCDRASSKIKSADNSETAAGGVDPSQGTPQFQFEELAHDFGQIAEGTLAQHSFKFKNTGNAPLIISNAQGSCGCTVPDYPRTPIAPGESGEIKVSFDSNGRPGRNDKQVTIDANTVPNAMVLNITSEVIAKPADASAKEAAK